MLTVFFIVIICHFLCRSVRGQEQDATWDEEIAKFHLGPHFAKEDMAQAFCKNSGGGSKSHLTTLDTSRISRLIKETDSFFGTVTIEKMRTTAHLTKAALALRAGGDIVETGVFTGKSAALMMRILMKFDQCGRKLYAFDSFQGLPERREKDRAHSWTNVAGGFAATQEEFEKNLKAVKAYDPSILVVSKGWFNTTLPASPVAKIALLRMDGDLYTSTKETIEALYDKVVPGGFIYVDDYGSFIGCRTAIDEFREKRGISDTIRFVRPMKDSWHAPHIDFDAIWWQKSSSAQNTTHSQSQSADRHRERKASRRKKSADSIYYG